MKHAYYFILKARGLFISLLIIILHFLQISYSQGSSGELKWLRINELHSYFSEQGCEEESLEEESITFSWPAQYGLEQSTMRARNMWLGCRNFYDTYAEQVLAIKVVGIGPRDDEDELNQVFIPEIFKLVGRSRHPIVVVDDQLASISTLYDVLDEEDQDLQSDRMIILKNNTSIGATVTKRVYAFTQQNHDNYFIYDYWIKNTGIISPDGDTNEQTLEDFMFYLGYRYSFSGEAVLGYATDERWAPWNASWGRNTVNDVIGTNPADTDFNDPYSPFYHLRAHLAWYSPHSEQPVTDDWGCPNYQDDGILAAAKYGGCVTLHADRSPQDRSDDLSQPTTTHYLDTDHTTTYGPYNQFDVNFMTKRYEEMTRGHANPTQAEAIEQSGEPANLWGPGIGGTQIGMGFGPYTLEPNDSIHIVIAHCIAGLSRKKNREVGGNWIQWTNDTGNPTLIRPNGEETTDQDLYKREWVWTCRDSLIKTFNNAMSLYQYLYEFGNEIAEPPPPPDEFTVESGGDRIKLTWANNATSWPDFDGYVIYRSEGNVMDPKTVYVKIFECDASNVVHQFDDVTAIRGFDYYYYIQSKDDGTNNDVQPGVPLYSGMFWTLTSLPAQLQRPAGDRIEEVRVVPNPYDIRARIFQFGEDFQYDRIAFYGLPPVCKVRIFTERGDLIWEKNHINYTGDELWDSKTSSGQIVVSGIYILHVELTRDIRDDNTGELLFQKGQSVYRKFVIIR